MFLVLATCTAHHHHLTREAYEILVWVIILLLSTTALVPLLFIRQRRLANERASSVDRWRKKHALTCSKCESLGYPVKGTERHYACENCGYRWTDKPHGMARSE